MLYPVHFVYVSVNLAEIERGCRLMIRFDKVSFTYQESLQNGGLRDVDLTINKGECVLLCGRSGCGKTTLTRLVNGLIPYFIREKSPEQPMLTVKIYRIIPYMKCPSMWGLYFKIHALNFLM